MELHSLSTPSQNGLRRLPQTLLLLLRTCLAGPSNHPDTNPYTDSSIGFTIRRRLANLISSLNPFVKRGGWLVSISVGMVELTVLCSLGTVLWQWSKGNGKSKRHSSSDASICEFDGTDVGLVETDPGLLKKHSTIRAYSVQSTGFEYPGIRTFFRPHHKYEELPKTPCRVPLLVFIHGLGGSTAQFNPILVRLSNVASCLAIDLPGCGRSSFEPKDWKAYTTDALVQLLAVAIDAHRDQDGHQKIVLIGHSMGCSLAALLASSTSPYANLISEHVSGLVAICPKADPPSQSQCKGIDKLTTVPGFLFDLYRKWDRRGGVNSASVYRMTGRDADEETKRLQLRFNRQSRTGVWQRMFRGMCPDYSNGDPHGGLPGKEIWAGLMLPIFLVAGEADQVTPVENVRRIVKFLGRDETTINPPSESASLPIAAAPFDPAVVGPELSERKHQDSGIDAGDLPDLDKDGSSLTSSVTYSQDQASIDTEAVPSKRESAAIIETGSGTPRPGTSDLPTPYSCRLMVKTVILPLPAAHSLLFAPTSSRIISGLISNFLEDHIDPRLSQSWQLQHLVKGGKWDVKNLKKWQAVEPVSQPIAGVFRAMKTLREVDEVHSPKVFVSEWASKIYAVVDISHDTPVYDPKGLEEGGLVYFKFSTVSKQPPTKDEVQKFVEIIDDIQSKREAGNERLVGVHCHYGFNRTGFFVVSYLIEKLGYKVQDAIDTFERARPPGIRHDHFIDELHLRYFSGLKKTPTL